jgi:ribosomal protein S17E
MLKSKGLEKQAAELEAIAAWMPHQRPIVPVGERPEEVVPGRGEFVGKGKIEIVDDLAAPGNKKVVSGGVLSEDEKKVFEHLVTLVDYYNKVSGSMKSEVWKRIEDVQKRGVRPVVVPEYRKLTPQEVKDKFRASMHLASIQSRLASLGYDALAHRVGENALRVIEATVQDIHQIMSIEALHERSGDHKEFEENIKKLAEMHEDAAKIIREFDREYISKVMNKKDLSEEEAVKETVRMIREADGKVSAKVMELERAMKFKKP